MRDRIGRLNLNMIQQSCYQRILTYFVTLYLQTLPDLKSSRQPNRHVIQTFSSFSFYLFCSSQIIFFFSTRVLCSTRPLSFQQIGSDHVRCTVALLGHWHYGHTTLIAWKVISAGKEFITTHQVKSILLFNTKFSLKKQHEAP